MCGLGTVALGIWIWERASSHFTNRKEQLRIGQQIKEMMESGIKEIDTGTAAALWAGTREEGNIVRHLRFRIIKSAINNGEIENPIFKDSRSRLKKKANIYTWIPLRDLTNYFIKRGVVSEKDF